MIKSEEVEKLLEKITPEWEAISPRTNAVKIGGMNYLFLKNKDAYFIALAPEIARSFIELSKENERLKEELDSAYNEIVFLSPAYKPNREQL